MHLKKFLLFGLIAAVLPAVAEEAADRKTATSLKYVTHELETRQNKFGADTNKAMEYTNAAGTVQKRAVKSDLGTSTTDTSLPMVGGVNTKLNQKQDDIDPVNDHTAVTYTGQPGGIGQKGIYQTTGTYTDQSDNLIDAKTFNAALKNGLDSEFVCSENRDPVSGLCWLYTIHNTADNGLPPEYTELEWIESDGTQYIDTELYGENGWNIETSIALTNTNSAQMLWGENGTSGRQLTLYLGRGAEYWSRWDGQHNGTNALQKFVVNQFTTVKENANGVYVNDELIFTFGETTDFTTADTIYIFKSNHSGGAGAKAKMKYIHITNGSTLVFHGVPAQHGTTVGMYDTVSRQFFENAGDGTFGAGPVVGATVYIPQNQ